MKGKKIFLRWAGVALAAILAVSAGSAWAALWTPAQVRSLACRDCGVDGLHPAFEAALFQLQKMTGQRLQFTCGVRCPSHNEVVGGVPQSAHLVGRAADVVVLSADQRGFFRLLRRVGLVGIAYPRRNFVHVMMKWEL